ncbi:hypothetical protein ACHAP5_008094 [Fusarium lateritium]
MKKAVDFTDDRFPRTEELEQAFMCKFKKQLEVESSKLKTEMESNSKTEYEELSKNIIAANIKKKLEVESSKLKTEMESNLEIEYESKTFSARDEAQLMESKKSTLRINMAKNKTRAATAKINVVEKAVSETP